MSLLVSLTLGTLLSLALTYWFYARKLPKKQAGEAFAFHCLLWLLLNVLSFVIPFMPGNLIFGIFYKSPAGTEFDGLHLGLSLMLYLPLINALLLLLIAPLLLNLKTRRTKVL